MSNMTGPKKRVLLLTDWIVRNNDWSFLGELLALGYECETVGVEITRKYNSRFKKIILLWSGYVWLGLKGFLRRKHFDVVIAYQGVAGLFYSFYRQLMFARGPDLVLMAFFFKKRRNPVYNWLRYAFARAALQGVDKVICYSSKEAEHYNRLFRCRQPKFYFVPYGVNLARIEALLTNDVHGGQNGQAEHAARHSASIAPQAANQSGGFIFSAGSSNRDYKTLFEAVRGLDCRVLVFAKKFNVAGLSVPENVELRFDVYGDEYYRHLLAARFIVVPLDDPEVSSGQMVLLEAMALARAVIITDGWGVADYVDDGVTSLLTPPHDSGSMQAKIELLLQDPEAIKRLGESARETVCEHFTVGNTVRGVSRIALEGFDGKSRSKIVDHKQEPENKN